MVNKTNRLTVTGLARPSCRVVAKAVGAQQTTEREIDARLVKHQHLVVITVRQLVQNHPGLLVDVSFHGQIGRPRHADTLRPVGGVAMRSQSVRAGVTLHGLEFAVG